MTMKITRDGGLARVAAPTEVQTPKSESASCTTGSVPLYEKNSWKQNLRLLVFRLEEFFNSLLSSEKDPFQKVIWLSLLLVYGMICFIKSIFREIKIMNVLVNPRI